MTEIEDKKDGLSQAIEQFVLGWGDMGSQWGVNRSVAQIHALLYLAETPLTAEDIADTLGIARSNVSNSLRELLSRRLIHRVPLRGDRRDHFVAETDLWQMATRIAQVRKEREIDPVIDLLQQAMAAAKEDRCVSATARTRLQDMHGFVGAVSGWYDDMLTVSPNKLMALVKLRSHIVDLLNLGRKRGRKHK